MNEINKKILIVEDDKDFLWILEQGFMNKGMEVIHAKDGQEGLAMAESEKPDLIIMDIQLPKMDGVATAKAIKEKGIKSQIIFLTNFNDAEHISQAVETIHETDYLVKSNVHVDQIVDLVKKKLDIK